MRGVIIQCYYCRLLLAWSSPDSQVRRCKSSDKKQKNSENENHVHIYYSYSIGLSPNTLLHCYNSLGTFGQLDFSPVRLGKDFGANKGAITSKDGFAFVALLA